MSVSDFPLAAVIGDPIGHSKSPRMHNYWLKKNGIKGRYLPLHVKDKDLETVLRALPKMGFVGANITVPHKVAVMSIADQISDRAALIGAANTLTYGADGKILADNTDGYGFISNLRQYASGWDATRGPAVVLGAGGASRAVLVALSDAGVPEILLSNRTRPKAEALKEEFGARIRVVDWVQAGNVLEEATTVVNTTSLGMTGQPNLRIPLDGLRPGAVVSDLVYAPLKTKFLQKAESLGCQTVDGLGMLLHQGAPGFERWFGVRPEINDELREIVLA